MKPFLLLAIRPEDVAADDEYAAILRKSGLEESELHRIRLDQRPLGEFDLDSWSGVILGGGPFQVSDDQDGKAPVQRRVESDLAGVLDQVVARDFPFLGACYGIGTLGQHQGAAVDRWYGEPVGAVRITLTPQGSADPLLGIAEPTFGAFGGHKEAIRELPAHAVNLASSPDCPVQAFRVGTRVYATQFHPELDLDGLATRVQTYKYAGYFQPHEADTIVAAARESAIGEPPNFLARFVELFAGER